MASTLDSTKSEDTVEDEIVLLLRRVALELARLEEFPPRPDTKASLAAAGHAVHLALVQMEPLIDPPIPEQLGGNPTASFQQA